MNRGIYLSGPTAADERRFGNLISLLDRTELNTVVLDIKEVPGKVWYGTEVPLAHETGAVKAIYPVHERLKVLREHGVYIIGRIVVFADDNLAKARPEWAIQDRRRGGVWRTYKGTGWMNPFRKEVWAYNIDLAREAARLGFDEIQYDYVRFPSSDGPRHDADYGAYQVNEATRVAALTEFLANTRKELSPLGVALSADVFGFTAVRKDDLGIGQKIEAIAQEVDYVCPMVYPSHYPPGFAGCENPAKNPREVISESLRCGAQKLRETNAQLRPWLQDFTLGEVVYGPEKVRTQIEVSEEHNTAGWMLWNSKNEYTETALLRSQEFSARPRVVCLLPARNAAADLPGYFESAARFCDAIVALDDGSTDNTRELLAACPLVKILLTNPPRDDYRGWDDAANRNRLLAAAAELNPEWIISIDADERIDPADAAALRDFLDRDALPGCAYGFRVVPMQEDLEHYRPQFLWVYRLFAYEPGQSFPNRRLHFVPVPTSIPRAAWVKTTLRIQHLGGMTATRRQARFEKYRQADPDRQYQSVYTHLLHEPSGDLHRWEVRPSNLHVLLDANANDGQQTIESADAPVISAIVISRNDEARIARTVESVVNQNCPEPFEVIVVTSGKDRTAAIVREQFPEVTLVELPQPALPGEARNAGLRLARGTYVSFPGSHVELPQGSLAARVRAHDLGYAMVTGVTLNGTRTWAGWTSYFLDHYTNLPGQPPAVLKGPPAHCSYARAPLLEVGGFPERLRTGEDTTTNMALTSRGYVAYRDPQVRITHHSPCRTPWKLLRHHFKRGRGLGRILLRNTPKRSSLLNGQFLKTRLLRYLPHRLRRTSQNVMQQPEYRRLYMLTFPLVVAGSVAAWLGMWYEILRSVIRSSSYSAASIKKLNTSRKVVALTFDMGSDVGYTEQILDTLADNGIRASFGITGEWAEKHPELLRRIVREKHTIINHTYSHCSFTGSRTNSAPLSYQERANELWKTESVFQSIAGASSKPYFRPPYSDHNTSVLADIYTCGYRYNILWSVDSDGWRGLTKEKILQRVLKGLEPGAIYLFHVGSQSQDGPALDAIISVLRERGYGFVAIDDFYRRVLPADAFQPNGVAEQTSPGSPEAFGRLVRHAGGQ
jgi:peptidoglycan/xylan/chitin deacetylase (PgdA/CDA1 family)